jgi:hypothetical protein
MKKIFLFIISFPLWGLGGFAFAQTQNTVIDPNFVQIPRLSTAPTCATNDKGKLYFNSNDNKMYFCNGSAWVDFSNGGFTLPYVGSGIFNSIGQVGLIKFENTGSGNGLYVKTGAGQLIATQQFAAYIESSGNGLYATGGVGNMALKTAGNLQFKNNNEGLGRVLTSDASGFATWQSNGAFFVTRNSDVSIPSGTETQIVFNSENFDPDDNYLSSGKFVAPRDGLYHFDATIDWTAAFSATRVYLQIKHFDTLLGVKRVATQFVESSGQEPHISCSATFLMLGSETVEVRVFQNSGSAKILESSASTYFSGYLIR